MMLIKQLQFPRRIHFVICLMSHQGFPLSLPNPASSCARPGLIQFRVLHRVLKCSQMCPRCDYHLPLRHANPCVVLNCPLTGAQSSKRCQTFSWWSERTTIISLELDLSLCEHYDQPPSWTQEVLLHLRFEKLRRTVHAPSETYEKMIYWESQSSSRTHHCPKSIRLCGCLFLFCADACLLICVLLYCTVAVLKYFFYIHAMF